MGNVRRPRPSWQAALAGAGLLAVSVAGCVSMASGGPVLSYAVTQGAGGQGQHYQQIIPVPPGPGWGPVDIVKGFLAASASSVGQQKVAREYLTPAANSMWKPSWSATVFGGDGPNVAQTGGTAGQRALVTVSGPAQASLSASGSYAFPSGTQGNPPFTFHLVKYGGQWRIAAPLPAHLLLKSVEFQADYQLRNLYFFDQAGGVLVPDPVYVPLQATPTNLVNGLVQDLIQPPPDWLSAATKTEFPGGTRLAGNVTVDGGTALVNLTGSAILHAPRTQLLQISAQLLWTLTGSGQGQPQYIELSLDGKPWIPPGAPNGSPVQSAASYQPAPGAYGTFYYLDAHGALWSQRGPSADPVRVASSRLPSLSAIAVSPGGQYLAGLHDGNVYTGPLGGRLTRRASGGYTSLSWDKNGNLLAAAPSGVVLLRADGGPAVSVSLLNSNGTTVNGTVTALRFASDGVRVALVIDGRQLHFGAITIEGQGHAAAPVAMVTLSPFYVSGSGFTSVTWYGADDVIALSAAPGLTEYPVNGGTSVALPNEPRMASITASSSGNALIAGLVNGAMAANPSTTGSWGPIGTGLAPVYPG